jgi:isopenicillin N synthase-like dioxygenase
VGLVSTLVRTVDLSPWWSHDDVARQQVAEQVDDACRRVGFLEVVGHGIPTSTIDAMVAATEAFFALPLEEKLAVAPPHPGINRGYAALGSEALSYSIGQAPPRPDLFEAFNIGEVDVPDDPWYDDPYDFFAPNLWPAALPALRPALEAYFREARRVALTMTDIFSVALGLGEWWFRPLVERSTTTMRVNHYERRRDDPVPVPGQMRMGAHTDYGVVTVLYADPVPGLEIVAPDGSWHPVTPSPGALVLNLGDLLAEWTNDRWRSTIHRVVPPPLDSSGGSRRRSVAFFFDANYDAVVECLATCCADDRPARYPPVVAGEHLMAKILGPRRLEPTTATLDTAADRLYGQTEPQPRPE